MTTYKNLRGKRVKTFATDLDNEQAEGQIFFSTASPGREFKTVVSSAAFSSTSPLLDSYYGASGAGSQTDGMVFGGISPSNTAKATTEEYNGSGFSVGGTLNTGRALIAGAGTVPAGLAFGGRTNPTTFKSETEEYNGTAWTESGDLNTTRSEMGGTGTQTAGLAVAGFSNPPNTKHGEVEEYDGTSWSEVNNYPINTYAVEGAGTQTAALMAGNFGPPYTSAPYAPNVVTEYDGTNFTVVNSMGTATYNGGMFGTQTSAIYAGGVLGNTSPHAAGQKYDGTNWTTVGSLAANTNSLAAFGDSASAGGVMAGGVGVTDRAYEYHETVNIITAGAWSSGGNLNTARSRGTGGGTLTAGICVNGVTVNVEEYDGTSWTEQNNLPAALRDMSGFGTQTAFVGCAGYQPGPNSSQNATNEYDGTNWASGGNMNTARDGTSLHFGGVLTAGLVNGGGTPPHKQTEEYNGTSWANANASSQHHYRTNITGTQTAAFIFGGYGVDPGGPQAGLSVTFTEEYDGTNFSAGDTLLLGANASLGMSNSNKDDSTCAGGFDQATSARLSLTQNYNGTVWATGASLGTARYAGTGGGSAAGGFVAAGSVPPNTNATEELTAETTSLNLKTITDS